MDGYILKVDLVGFVDGLNVVCVREKSRGGFYSLGFEELEGWIRIY